MRTRTDELLLGEWAVLGILAHRPAHGFAVAKQLAQDGEVGRVWSLSRPLTYRAIDQLQERDLIAAVGAEPGRAGGPRTIYAPTASGNHRLRAWLAEPASHLRDVRTELLVKLVLCDLAEIDPGPLVRSQLALSQPVAARWSAESGRHRTDPVTLWRAESSKAVVRFLNRFAAARDLNRNEATPEGVDHVGPDEDG